MLQPVPGDWVSIKQKIQSVLLETGVNGFFTISIENPRFADLYMQGTWNSQESIWLEMSLPEDAPEDSSAALIARDWNSPTDDVPNFWKELTWDPEDSATIAAHLIQAMLVFGLAADDCELLPHIENEK
jgi:hypothetical protein